MILYICMCWNPRVCSFDAVHQTAQCGAIDANLLLRCSAAYRGVFVTDPFSPLINIAPERDIEMKII